MNDSLLEVNRLLEKIRSGQSGRDEVIVSLYRDKKLRNSFNKMIRNEGWPASAMENMLTESIIAFCSSVIRRKDFELNSDLYNYILVIGKRSYTKEQSKVKNFLDVDDYKDSIEGNEVPLEMIFKKETTDVVQGLLSKLGRNCREVLTFWASSYSMKEIAEMMGYKSDMMARKKKYNCFNELVNYINNNPEVIKLLR